MTTMIDQLSEAQHEDGGFPVMPIEPVFVLADETHLFDDEYADCELRTRHERTERMIRKAKEQA